MSFAIFKDNRLTTRQDVVDAHNEVFEPLISRFSEGGARVRIGKFGSSCKEPEAELEGFSRPLWGAVSLMYAKDDFKFAALYRKGTVNGCNPLHQDYWGEPGDFSQILVDLAAIAYGLCMCKDDLWDPMSASDKEIVIKYLSNASGKQYCHNNWKFFKVLVDLALEHVGVPVDLAPTMQYLDDIDSMYLGEGWYGDGKPHRIDYYNGFAFHFYGLLYVHLRKHQDPQRCSRLLERAEIFAKQFVHWFSDDGASLPYGRSLVYRFSVIGFWGLLAFVSDTEKAPVIPWGVMKGIYLHNLHWWSTQPILENKFLSLGYSYPNCFMTERYNSPQSPYWAAKAFSALLMPDSHPFWTSSIEPLAAKTHYISTVGMHFSHYPGNTVALINGPWNDEYQPEKYSKFAYSTRYGFGVISNHRTFEKAHLDNMIGFSFNNREFSVRESYKAFTSKDEKGDLIMISKWEPIEGVFVESHMLPRDTYHIRVHHIRNTTSKQIFTKEGGYAIPSGKATAKLDTSLGLSSVESGSDVSIIKDIYGNREPTTCFPEPNTNILHPRVVLPELTSTIPPNCNVTVGSMVFGAPCGQSVPHLSHFGYQVCGECVPVLCNQ